MRPLKSLTFESVVGKLSASFLKIFDSRMIERVKYSLHGTLMSGFAMMFFQHPSLLQFQERMKQKRGRCNLETIFKVTAVPSDTQMREILDDADPEPPAIPGLDDFIELTRPSSWLDSAKPLILRG